MGYANSLIVPRIDPEPPPASGGLVVAGEFSRASGLGEGARLMATAARQLGVKTWEVDVSRLLPADPGDFTVDQTIPKDIPPAAPIVFHVNPPMLPMVMRQLPRRLHRGRLVIGYWSWELEDAPDDWRVGLRCVHQVWVPSHFVAKALTHFAPAELRVVPHPVAITPSTTSGLTRRDFALPTDGRTIFLASVNIASSFERKNILATIRAFRAAFDDRNDRMLVLKIGNSEHYREEYQQIEKAIALAKNIVINVSVLSRADLLSFIQASDVVVSLHRSEGFGLFLAEAMLLGKPVIATGWSGNMDFMDDTTAVLVKYRLVPVHDPRGVYRDGVWAEPDQDDAIAKMRWLANDAEARSRIGKAGRAMAQARLGPGDLSIALREIGLR